MFISPPNLQPVVSSGYLGWGFSKRGQPILSTLFMIKILKIPCLIFNWCIFQSNPSSLKYLAFPLFNVIFFHLVISLTTYLNKMKNKHVSHDNFLFSFSIYRIFRFSSCFFFFFFFRCLEFKKQKISIWPTTEWKVKRKKQERKGEKNVLIFVCRCIQIE